MGAWHESEEMPSRGNSTTTKKPVGKPATGRHKTPVQKKCKMNVPLNLLSCFCLCIPFAGWKENWLVHIAQILTSLWVLPRLPGKGCVGFRWLWSTC
jgi:hypothetical protein